MKVWPAALLIFLSQSLFEAAPPLSPKTQASQTTPSPQPLQTAPQFNERKMAGLDPKMADVLQALEANPPEGRSWENLPADDFIEAVEEWADEILMAANLEINNPQAKMIGHRLFQHESPYLQYLGFSLIYRSGLFEQAEIESTYLMLKNPALTEDLFVEDLEIVSHEHKVRHTLVVDGIIQGYGRRMISDLKNNLPPEEWEKSRTRIKNALAKIPDAATHEHLSFYVDYYN